HSVSFPGTIGDALDLLAILEEKLAVDKLYPCHNDLLPSNLLDDGRSIQIIDWEYAGMGDRFFDLGNLAANGEFQAEHEEMLIELYFGAANPDHLARLRLMRLVSDMREAMWGFLQAGISTLDFKYSEYGLQHLDRFLQRCASAGLKPAATAI